MSISALPLPPSRQDPTNFNDRADTFLGALPLFQSEANALQTDVNAKQVLAATSATNAAASELAAANTSGATIWISGTTYAVGANRFSPINFLTYRRKTAGAGTTDPSLDATNWQLLTGLGDTTLQAVYPVGSIYINAGVTTNPATLFGFGTWTAFGAGKVMIGIDSGDPLFDTLGETGGSKDSVVVSHNHTATSTSSFAGNALAAHNHIVEVPVGTPNDNGGFSGATNNTTLNSFTNKTTTSTSAGTPSGTVTTSTTINSIGSSGTNANLQPYVVVSMWLRTA